MKYTVDQKRELVLRYQNGESVSNICIQTGIARGTLYSWLKPYQITVTDGWYVVGHTKRLFRSQETSGEAGEHHSSFEIC